MQVIRSVHQHQQKIGDLQQRSRRAGVGTLDYILVIGIILPIAAIAFPMGIRIVRSVYEMACVLITWPFL